MFSARDLLGSLMQAGVSQSANDRLGNAMGPQGLGRADSPFGQILGQVLGGGGQGQGQGQGGGLGDVLGGLMGKAGGMVGDASAAVKSGNPLAVGGLAALAGALLGGGGDAVKGALGGGLLAVLGGLAMNVLKNQASAVQGQPLGAAPLGLRAPESASEEAVLEERALVLIRAMVSAAKADGQIDAAERGRIAGQVKESGAGAEALEFLMAEMQRPQDLAGLVAQVRGPEEAVEVYAASLLAVEVDTAAERDYLARLARSLGLDAGVVGEVHRTLGVPQLA
jgi:uncharacterized membrane protein YebE (DUF533 family)